MFGRRIDFKQRSHAAKSTLECGFESLEDRSLLAANLAVMQPAVDPAGSSQVTSVNPASDFRSLTNVNGTSVLGFNLSDAGNLNFQATDALGGFPTLEIYGDRGLIASSTTDSISVPNVAAGNYYVRLVGVPSATGLRDFNFQSSLSTVAGGVGTVTLLDQAPEDTGDFNVQAAAVIFRNNVLSTSQSDQAVSILSPATGVTNNFGLSRSSPNIPLGSDPDGFTAFVEPAPLLSLLDQLDNDQMTLSQRQNLAPTITFDEARFRPENLDFTDSRRQRTSSNPEDPGIAIRFYQTEPADDRRAPLVVPGAWGFEDYLEEVLLESLDRMDETREFNRSGSRIGQPREQSGEPRSSIDTRHTRPPTEVTDQVFSQMVADRPPAVPIANRRQE